MPKVVYTPFDADEIQKESDPEIQALVDQVFIIIFFFNLKIDSNKIRKKFISF